MSEYPENDIQLTHPNLVREKYLHEVQELSDYAEKAFNLSRDGEQHSGSGLWNEEIAAFIDSVSLKHLFFSEDWVFIIIDLIALKISSRPLDVVKVSIDNGIKTTEKAPGHPLNALIQHPNASEDYHAWMYRLIAELCLMGNGMFWFAPSINQMFVLQTEKMSLNFDKKGRIKDYVMSTQVSSDALQVVETFPARQIAHTKRPNPNSLFWGLSPFIPGRKSILFNRYSSDYLNAFYLKQATPGLILKLERDVNENIALRQLRSFELANSGRANAKRTMILPKGVSADTVTPTIADQNLINLINLNRDTIRNIFKIPPHEFGLQAAGSLGSEEHKITLVNFWEATLMPTMRIVEGTMNKFFADMLGEGFEFKFDTSKVEALQANNEKRAKEGERMLKAGLSVNEVRRRIWDEPPSDLPSADIPFVIDPDPPREIVRTEEQESKSMGMRMIGSVSRMVKKLSDLENEKEAKLIEEISLEFFVHVLSGLPSILKRHLKDTKAIKADIDDEDELEEEIESLGQEFSGAWTKAFETLISTVELGYDQQLDVVFNARDENAIQAMRERDKDERSLILKARGIESFKNISATTTDQIMDRIRKGVENNETADRIAEGIANEFKEITPSRARTIARTETLTAVSIGHNAAMQNAREVFGPELKKTWINVGDLNVRNTHADPSMSKVIKFDETFPNGLHYPREPGGPASEVINCRCTIIMIPPGG
jgi:HK97 family phage portal protein